MAVSIFKSPPPVVGVYNSIEWILKISDIGTPGVNIKKIGYYLATDGGVPLTETESIQSPAVNMEIPLNFTLDCRGLVQTMFPQLGMSGVTEDQFFSKKIKLMVGEIVTDLVSCETTSTIETPSSVVTILNSALQTYEYADNYFASPRILSHVPKRHRMVNTANFYLWVWKCASVTVTNSDGDSLVYTTTPDVSVVPLKASMFLAWENLTYFDVNVAGVMTFRVNLYKPDCEANLWGSERTIQYLDPLGGRYYMSFEEIDNYSMSSNYEVTKKIERFKLPTTFAGDDVQLFNSGGETVINKTNKDTITLVTTTAVSEQTTEWVREYYKAFLASPSHHIFVQTGGSFAAYHKFIIESGTIKYKDVSGEIDMIITGYVSPTYRTQTIDR